MAATIELEDEEIQAAFLERGWTDGLPIVGPTPERVEAMLDEAFVFAEEVLGTLRGRALTAEMAAVNAVMAGCAPEHFPIAMAALGAMLDPTFRADAVLTSTGGAALCVV